MKNNLLPIAKEGWRYIFFSVLAIFIFSIFNFTILEFFTLVITGTLIYIYRNPERESILYGNSSIVAPSDGRVILIDEIKNDKQFAYKLCIDSSYLDVSLLRSPLNSEFISINIRHGSRLSKSSPLSSKINEYTELLFKDKNKNTLKVKHMLKQSFSPIEININNKQCLVQGSRYGVMLNGVTTLYLAQNFRMNVNVGDDVQASQTLIGYFS
ncbi:MAG: phosphatidylserine decarboxylase [Sulfurimonas sp.]|nr:MAG: phosphatidylserine decarboxylase [Sulfurimonas sp.]